MKSNIILKIGGQLVDMTDNISFSITKLFKDLGLPTNIINDWSKTIVVPFTANNNRIFGNIYRADRYFTPSSSEFIGLYFDPSKKVDFELIWNNNLVMEGYMKMSSIEKDKGYSINLFGGLGKVFSELKKLTPILTDTITDNKYLVNPLGIDGFYLTKENVGQSWQNARNKFNDWPLVNIIGFTPTNSGYYDSFDSKVILLTTNTEKFTEFTDVLSSCYENTIYNVDSIVGDGLLPRQICDFRSYYAQPYLFVDEMFKTLLTKCSQLTDYSLILDEDWFNTDNPYYYNGVMLLKKPEHNSQSQNTYAGHAQCLSQYIASSKRWGQSTINNVIELTLQLDNIDGITEDNEILISNGQTLSVKYSIDVNLRLLVDLSSFHNLSSGAALVASVGFVDPDDDTVFISTDYYFVSQRNTWKDEYYDHIYRIQDSEWKLTSTSTTSHRDVKLNINGEAALKYYKFRNNVKVKVFFIWIPDGSGNVIDYGAIPQGLYLYPSVEVSSIMNYEISSNDNRSYDYITFNDIWDNDYNYFDQCLKYTKMFNLVWDVDDNNKTITVLPLPSYFAKNTDIEDWTDKADFDSNYKIEPLIYDSKYYKFGYEESEIGLGQTYKQKHGTEYGDKIITTKYNFNDSTNNLIEGLKTPIINTTNVFAWPDMYAANVVYRQCKEPMLCLGDNENGAVNGFGSFLFYRGLRSFTDLGRSICLSDDTQAMQNTHKYTYIESGSRGGGLTVTTYPWLDVIYKGQGLNLGYYFGRPKQKYDALTDYSTFHPIYDVCWLNYITEYTNLHNHKLTANVFLTPTDFINFKFNKMVKIGSQIYMVNKIGDYNFGDKTKCELIRVADADNYRTWAFPAEELPTASMMINNLAAADNTSLLWCQIKTNISNFNKENVRIVYKTTEHGTLTLKTISDWNNDMWRLFFDQSGFTGTTDGQIEIIYQNKHQATPIVLLTANWKIAISEGDDPVISTSSAKFNVDSVSVADTTSTMTFVIYSYSNGITQDNFFIEKKAGAGTLTVSKWQRVSNNPVVTSVIVSQSGFTSAGGNGNFVVKIGGEIVARIPWHIIIDEAKLPTVKITSDRIDNVINGDIVNGKLQDIIYVSNDNKLLALNENNELVESTTADTELGAIKDFGNGKFLLTFDNETVSNGIKINTSSISLYKNGVSKIAASQAPSRYPVSIDLDNLELAEVEE